MGERYLVILFVLFFRYDLYPQSKIDFYFELAPNYSFRSYKEVESGNDTNLFEIDNIVYKNFSSFYESLEKPSISFEFNTGFDYHIKSNVDLHFGIGYKKLVLKITETYPLERYPFGDTIPPPDNEYTSETFHHSFHYFSVPVNIQYFPWKMNSLKIGFLLGFDTDFYIGKNYKDKKISSREDIKYQYASISKLCIGFRGGIKISYTLNESISLSLSPEFVHYVLPNVKYDIHVPSPLAESDIFSKINQYYYFGQLKFGLTISK